MNREEIEDIFPLEVEVTEQELKGNIYKVRDCIGARTMRKALEEKGIETTWWTWGGQGGTFEHNGGLYEVRSSRLMELLKEPCKITLSFGGFLW